jgi:hypothetical protein
MNTHALWRWIGTIIAILLALLAGLWAQRKWGILVSYDKPGPIRVRFFNGVNSSGVSVRVQAWKNEDNEDGYGRSVAFDQAAHLMAFNYQTDEMGKEDYTRFVLYLDGQEVATFKASVLGGTRLHTIAISRHTVGGNPKHHAVVTYGSGPTPSFAYTWDES